MSRHESAPSEFGLQIEAAFEKLEQQRVSELYGVRITRGRGIEKILEAWRAGKITTKAMKENILERIMDIESALFGINDV